MAGTLRPLVAGNWKMNGLKASAGEFRAMLDGYDSKMRSRVDLLVCPPVTLLAAFVETAGGSDLRVGGQDCHFESAGAHTGDISAEMLADLGASDVIVGHSERRSDHGEDDSRVRAKAEAALRAGLRPIVCVGETRQEREAGRAEDVVGAQLAGSLPPGGENGERLTVAYEPVWAIGTGLTPENADIADMHAFIRARLIAIYGEAGRDVRILYGGSVKPGNAAEILGIDDVNGALVGGASLKAADFLAIAAAAG